ncbi:MAG: TIGR02300 family protein [Alphaproteobacteria bacterium]|nr:TIGR02300 family protein [Alphaproteobacteria bacterium]
MAKTEWGTKHLCANCGAKFYDLKKKPPVCPKCETKVEPEQPKSRRRAAAAESKAAPAESKAAPAESKAAPAESKAAPAESKAAAAGVADDAKAVEGLEDVDDDTEDDTEDESLPEDTSDLGGNDDVVGEVVGPADAKTEES